MAMPLQAIGNGLALSFGYELIRAVSNGIVILVFSTSIDEWVAGKMGVN